MAGLLAGLQQHCRFLADPKDWFELRQNYPDLHPVCD
jgi:hypothetical protein